MNYISSNTITDLKLDIISTMEYRNKRVNEFYGTDHNFQNCIIVQKDIDSGLPQNFENIFIYKKSGDSDSSEISNNPEESENLEKIANNLSKAIKENIFIKFIYQETSLSDIDDNPDLFIYQTVRAFETFKLNKITPICSIIKFYKMSDRFTNIIYLAGNETEKAKQIYNDLL